MKNLELFPWSNRFATGITEIDDQHKQLVHLLNKLVGHMTSGEGNLALSAVFAELKRYANFHFRSEEKVWKTVFTGDAWEVEHEKSHQRFIEDVNDMEARNSSLSTHEMMKTIARFLAHWLALHILEHDHKMAKVLAAVRAGGSLEDAKAIMAKDNNGPNRVVIDTILAMYDSIADRTLQLASEVNLRIVAEQNLLTAHSELAARTDIINERNSQLNAMFRLSPDGYVAFSRDGRISFVNPAFQSMTGIDAEMLLGHNEEHLVALLQERRDPSRADPDFQTIVPGTGADPVVRTLALNKPRSVVLHVIGIASDSPNISNIVYLRDTTNESMIDQMRSEFLATTAHELRNPMASIYGFSEVLLTQDIDAATREEIVGIIHSQSELMVSILNELLDLARIEAKQGKDFNSQELTVQDLLTTAIAGQYIPTGRSAPRLICPDEPIVVVVDREKFVHAVMNVISNAYKYSPGGGDVRIVVECLDGYGDEASPTPAVAIRISDHGIGMSPEQVARVGERFYRADCTGSIPGTGLGMSIVMEIMALLNGRVRISSEPDVGTTVSLLLPRVRPPALHDAK